MDKEKANARLRDLTMALCTTLGDRHAAQDEGKAALATLLVSCMIDDGMTREAALATLGQVYDYIARLKKNEPIRGEDFKFVFVPETQEALDADPKLQAMMKDMQAEIRQALDGLATGRFATEEEAFKSIGAVVIDLDEDDDDDVAGHA